MVFPVVGIYLLWRKGELRPWCWMAFGAASVLGLMCVFGPWLVLCGDQFRFALDFHTARATGGVVESLLLKVGFLSRMGGAYFVMFALMAGVAVAWWMPGGRFSRRADMADGVPATFPLLLLAMALAVTILHVTAPFPYDDYQAPIYPLLAVVTAAVGWAVVEGWGGGCRGKGAVQGVILAVILGQAATSPVNQGWFVYGRDRFWWLKKDKPDVIVLRDTARQLNALHPQKGVLLTQDTYLAVEAGWSVPSGFEMGPFSYFPGLTTEEALHYRVLNREVLSKVLAAGEAPLAVFSGYGLGIESPSMVPVPEAGRQAFFEILGRRYEEVGQVPAFGQAHTTLTIWRLKGEGVKQSEGVQK
jgi:hypothetical protein